MPISNQSIRRNQLLTELLMGVIPSYYLNGQGVIIIASILVQSTQINDILVNRKIRFSNLILLLFVIKTPFLSICRLIA